MDALQFDKVVFLRINEALHAPWLDPIMWVFTSLGIGWVQILIILLTGLLWRRWGTRLVYPGLAAFASSGIAVQVLKQFIGGPRPGVFFPEHLTADEQIFGNAFPSGHTGTSFAIAAIFFVLIRRSGRPWLAWLPLLIAVMVGLSRIYRGVHWPTDVTAGALLGLVCGYFCIRWFDRLWARAAKDPVAKAQLDPSQ